MRGSDGVLGGYHEVLRGLVGALRGLDVALGTWIGPWSSRWGFRSPELGLGRGLERLR